MILEPYKLVRRSMLSIMLIRLENVFCTIWINQLLMNILERVSQDMLIKKEEIL